MTEEKTLKDEIREISESLKRMEESGLAKKVKAKGKIGRGQLKKGYMRFVIINENRNVNVKKLPVEEGTALLEKAPRLATSDYVLFWDNQPTIILPAWSTEPFSPASNYEQAVRDKMLSAGYRLLANRVELGKLEGKKGLSGGMIFAIIIAVIIGGYLLFFR